MADTCTAQVKYDKGIVTTHSCKTDSRCECVWSNYDDTRERYRCPDCGTEFEVDWSE